MLKLTFPASKASSSIMSVCLSSSTKFNRLPFGVIFHLSNLQSSSSSSFRLPCRKLSSSTSRVKTGATSFGSDDRRNPSIVIPSGAIISNPSKQRQQSCSLMTENGLLRNVSRRISTTSVVRKDSSESQSWLSKLSSSLMVRKIETGKDSHSRLLADSEAMYELQIHDVKPDSMSVYLNTTEKLTKELSAKVNDSYVLVASWRVEIGDQDQVVNIWRYKKGYRSANETQKSIRSDSTLSSLLNDQTKSLRSRQNQFMMAFSFWGHPSPAIRDSYYEMRSYVLKPGTMIEWGNNWARGINFRTNQVAGFFSQIGQLYMVHHIWHYQNLQARKDIREDSWTKPGWDEIVAYTVPLIRELRTRWMSANSFSPIR